MNRVLNLFMVLIIAIKLAGCSKDTSLGDFSNPMDDENGDNIVMFEIPHWNGMISTEGVPVTYTLEESDSFKKYQFQGILRTLEEKVFGSPCIYTAQFRIQIDNEGIPAGCYHLKIDQMDEGVLANYFVEFASNKIRIISEPHRLYSALTGDGTKQRPFQITTTEDLKLFLDTLASDASHAYGLYFTQLKNIQLAFKMGDSTSGDTYMPAIFSGTYNGSNHRIDGLECSEPMPQGLSTGLFRIISNATVSNLSLTKAKIKGNNDGCGILAGHSIYNNTISGVSVQGSVEAGNNTGFLIGRTLGKLELDKIDINGSITGGDQTGGLIGSLEGTMIAKDITVVGVIDGSSQTGGLSGYLDAANGKLELDKIDINGRITGGDQTGGLVGSLGGTVIAKDITVFGSIVGSMQTGGLFGYLDAANNPTLKEIAINIKLKGSEQCGGICGRMENGACQLEGKLDIKAIDRQYYHGTTTQVSYYPGFYANKYAGGFAGWADLGGQTMDSSGVDLNVVWYCQTKEGYASHLFGYLTNGNFDASGTRVVPGNDLYMTEEFLKISSTGCAIGGIAGHLNNAKISHSIKWDSKHKLPLVSTLPKYLRGTLVGTDEVGGVVGRMTGSYETTGIYGITSNCIVKGSAQVGGIVGHMSGGSIKKCFFHGTRNNRYMVSIGGIVGLLDAPGVVEECCNYTDNLWGECGGGVIGVIDARHTNDSSPIMVNRCFNIGKLSNSQWAGGIIGKCLCDQQVNFVTISHCENYGTLEIAGSNENYASIGGIVGETVGKGVTISECFNHASVFSERTCQGVGGIAGKTEGIVMMCLNSGTIASNSPESSVGGILGIAQGNAKISGCVNWGEFNNASSG